MIRRRCGYAGVRMAVLQHKATLERGMELERRFLTAIFFSDDNDNRTDCWSNSNATM